jgi:hypothetical protein
MEILIIAESLVWEVNRRIDSRKIDSGRKRAASLVRSDAGTGCGSTKVIACG